MTAVIAKSTKSTVSSATAPLRGINLGCGKICLPCSKPSAHAIAPDWLYDGSVAHWDNVDIVPLPGVDLQIDLFDYPWRTKAGKLPDATYDVALASHIAEHIPHTVTWEGQVMHRHPLYQDGFFAWFGELNRILKPGGVAYIICPYGWSNGALTDPTHTRYLMPGTFNYLCNEGEGGQFVYQSNGARWQQINYETDYARRPHAEAYHQAHMAATAIKALSALVTDGVFNLSLADGFNDEHVPTTPEAQNLLFMMMDQLGHKQINGIVEFMITLRKATDAD